MLGRPRTLRGRLALFYAGVLAVVLVAFSATVLVVVMQDEAAETARGEPPEPIDHRLVLALCVGLPGALAIAIGGGLWITRRALGPIEEVIKVTEGLDADNLTQRIPSGPSRDDEVVRLVGALNGMLERMERSVGGLRRFTADASHELRTPISTLMSQMEVALSRPRSAEQLSAMMAEALEELGNLSRLIESLLTLARSDAGELPQERLPFDVREIVARAVTPYEEIAAERGLQLTLRGAEEAHVVADRLWLGRAISNLIDNACKFTPRGGTVAVRVETEANRIRVCVSDTGPGLVEAERDRAFERFYRGDSVRGSSDGFGLGLSLAKQIVEAMGGELSLTGHEGGGTIACVALPAAPSPLEK